MREIKFRGWNGKEICRVHYVTDRGIGATGNGGMIIPREGSDHSIMQFTGLYDCKGVEIYEGDIVKCNNGHIGVVEWESHDATFNVSDYYCSSNDFPTMAFIEGQPFDVIGNIHQHKHLIDGENDSE